MELLLGAHLPSTPLLPGVTPVATVQGRTGVRGSSLLGPKWAGFPGFQEREVSQPQQQHQPSSGPCAVPSVSTLHVLNP